MASRGTPLPAGRSPLRAHLPRRQQPSSAASSHLRHLHQVAVWASLFVPPLGAFLGSRLASTSEHLGCPPPSSPHFTCQRCESILRVGMNCSVRVRTRKLKKQTKGVSAHVNSIMYKCHYCAFETMMPGTSKAYVKTKLSEMAACHKLSEPCQSLDVCVAEKVTLQTKMNNSDLFSCSKVLSRETPVSTAKRTKRKGWLTLKQLAASSPDSPLVGNRLVFSPRSAESPLLLQSRKLDTARAMPTVSQMDLKYLTPTLGLEELRSKGTSSKRMSEVGLCEGDKGSKKMGGFKVIDAVFSKLKQSTACSAHVNNPSGDATSLCVQQSAVSGASGVATNLWSDADVVARNVEEFTENPPANAADSLLDLQQSDTSGCTLNAKDGGLQQKSCNHHSGAVSQTGLEIFAPTSLIQDIPLVVKNGNNLLHEKDLDSSMVEKKVMVNKIVTGNSTIVKVVKSRKRLCNDDNQCKVFKKERNCELEADRSKLGELDIKGTRGKIFVEQSVSNSKNRNTPTLGHERKAKSRTKKKPLFRRVGRQWFTICKFKRTLKWRII